MMEFHTRTVVTSESQDHGNLTMSANYPSVKIKSLSHVSCASETFEQAQDAFVEDDKFHELAGVVSPRVELHGSRCENFTPE